MVARGILSMVVQRGAPTSYSGIRDKAAFECARMADWFEWPYGSELVDIASTEN